MSYDRPRDRRDHGPTPGRASVASTPGKRALTDSLRAPVQAHASASAAPTTGDVTATARAGVSGPGGVLPHLDRIQASFGHHDVSGVRAHVGGAAGEAAAANGASGYATGDDVAFAQAPSVRLAAHE